ncbi:MAG: hypothetical protein HKM97_01780 [Acidimicrobiia bacterium]|nr:hypothetical protein [Acidimicrobiia bacterium]
MMLVLAAGACGGADSEPAVVDEGAIYGDLVVRLCDQARCGPSHPAFVLLEADGPDARTGVLGALPDVVFISTTDGLIGPDDQVIEGGRILRLGPVRRQSDETVVLIDTYWESSWFDAKGETYAYQWTGTAWVNIDPSTVGITVTTAVP